MTSRLSFLDILRAIAGLSVLLVHALQSSFAEISATISNYFSLGHFGVTVFFFISGFIIPQSLFSYSSQRTFWYRRFFRIYPLYLVTLLGAIVLLLFQRSDIPLQSTITDLFMVSKLVGKTSVVPPFWTLHVELLFYVITSVLFAAGFLKKSITIYYAFALVSLLVALVTGYKQSSGWGIPFHLVCMFAGTVYYDYYKGIIAWRSFFAVSASFTLLACIVPLLQFTNSTDPFGSTLPYFLSFAGANAIFIIIFHFRDRIKIASLDYLGKISYSIYLTQYFLVEWAHQNEGVNPFLKFFLIVAGTLLLSAVTYYLIEEPFIAYSKKRFSNAPAKIPTR